MYFLNSFLVWPLSEKIIYEIGIHMYVPGTDRPMDEFRKERILVREEFRISKHKTAGPTEYQRRKA